MSHLNVEVPAMPAGWSHFSGSGIHLVLGRPVDDALGRQLRAVLRGVRGRGHDLLDDLLDVLLGHGVGALPDFVAVDETDPVRLVVRGASVARVTVGSEVRLIAAAGARTWVDVEVRGRVQLVNLHLAPVVAMQALPCWPDAAPLVPVAESLTDDHDELPSYDGLFGSTRRAMAFHAEDEPVTPQAETVTAQAEPEPDSKPQPQPEPKPQPAVAPEPTLTAPHELAPAQARAPQASHPSYPEGCLRFSTGEVVSLDRGVLLGRAPGVNGDLTERRRPHVMRLHSADNDISRNHAEVFLERGRVLVRDLGSTNGTTVASPGQEPGRLRGDERQVLEAGTVVALADEVSFTFEVAS